MSTTQPTEAQRVHLRRAVGFVLMSAVLPGSVQSFAGNRRIGRLAMRVYGAALVLILITGLGLLVARGFTAGVLLEPWVTMVLRVVLWILFIGWALLLLDSWRLSRPLGLRQKGRLGLSITALLLIAGIGGVTGLAASALTGVSNVGEVFQGGGDTEKKAGRYNILLLGADAAASREGLRPDSINVASIDAETGRTVLFGLPRNMQRVRFPESSPLRNLYPDGYVCDEGACMLNGLWTLGEEHADLYPEDSEPGLEAMKEGVSETLGIELNYYAMVDMGGFKSLIDAMGGIRLDISKPIPIGGGSTKISGYIEPGKGVLLDGYHALWFARSRAESNDYERMVRQKCVMSAMAKQLDPMTAATKFVDLSQASKDILRTDVPRAEVATLAELALKVKDQKIASVNFTPPMVKSADPDFDLIRTTVKAKLDEAEGLDEAAPSPAPTSAAPSSAAPEPEAPATSAAAKPSETKPSGEATPAAQKQATPKPEQTKGVEDDAPYTQTEDLEAVCSVSA